MPRKAKRIKRLVRIPNEYFEVIKVGETLFSPLYQLENGLRLAINSYLANFYGDNWWEYSLKIELPQIYDYAEKHMQKRGNMPSIAKSKLIKPLPIHFVTLGHLEDIVKKYQSDCIPTIFPTLEFFLGHMHVIKEVRNLFSHMFPCITKNDAQTARREIKTLSEHINEKL